MSINWQLAEPRPAILVLPPGAASLDEAHAAIELWEHYTRKTLDDAQRLAVEVMMARTRKGRWAAATTGREMPRQNGKGDEIEVVELWGLVQLAEAIMHTIHDAVLLATQTQQRMLRVIEGHADLRRKMLRRWTGTGQQMIEMRNGGIIWYRTRTSGGGRGVDEVDRYVVDEAQHATTGHISAASPTLLASSNPQMNALGTSALAGHSGWWWEQRTRAISPDPGSFGYVGHTAERLSLDSDGRPVQEPVDVEDRAIWPQVNPALHVGRVGVDYFEEQFRRLGAEAFGGEHLGVWCPPPVTDGKAPEWQIVTEDVWLKLADPQASRGAKPVFGVDVGSDRLAHVAVAWRRSDGGVHVMLADTGLSPLRTPERLAELVGKWKGPVVLGGPSASLEADVKRSSVMSAGEFVQASGRFDDLLTDRKVRHGNQPELNAAVKAAQWRSVGTAGALSLQLRDAPAVGPLAAAVRAVHGVFAAVRPPAAPRSAKPAVSKRTETADLSTLSF